MAGWPVTAIIERELAFFLISDHLELKFRALNIPRCEHCKTIDR